MTQKHPIDRASDVLGGGAKLAALLGVSAQAISNWKERGVPIERCLEIERATQGAVTRRDLRSDWKDIWPELEAPATTAAPQADPGRRDYRKPRREGPNKLAAGKPTHRKGD